MTVILVSRKPLNGTVANNALRYGTGGINIDGCRVSAGKEYTEADYGPRFIPGAMAHMGSLQTRPWVLKALAEGRPVKDSKPNQAGRWPANLIFEHKPGCKCTGTKDVKPSNGSGKASDSKIGVSRDTLYEGGWKQLDNLRGFVSETGKETVSAWDCEVGCPIAVLDSQSSITKSVPRLGGVGDHLDPSRESWRFKRAEGGFTDVGGASRFFKQIQATSGNNQQDTEGVVPMKIPQQMLDYLTTLISPPARFGEIVVLDLATVNLEGLFKDGSQVGIIALGEPTPEQSADMLRALCPGAHLLVIPPEERPMGFEGACNVEDAGFEIRDSILWVREAGGFYYVPKPARTEREAGCQNLPARTGAEAVDREEGTDGLNSPRAGAGRTAGEIHNHHCTVKPIAIMKALLGDVSIDPDHPVLDPFVGSGTTGIACVQTGHSFIGIEREPDYLKIADARVRHWANKSTDHFSEDRVEIVTDAGDARGGGGESGERVKAEPEVKKLDSFWGDDD